MISYYERTFTFARAPRARAHVVRVHVHALTRAIVDKYTRARSENESCFKARAGPIAVDLFVVVGNGYFSFRPVEHTTTTREMIFIIAQSPCATLTVSFRISVNKSRKGERFVSRAVLI